MSTELAVGDRLEFRCYTADNEQASVNTFNYRVQSVNTPGFTDQQAVDAFSTFIASTYKSIIYNGARYQGTTCSVANRIPLRVPVSSAEGAGVGTGGAIGLPRQTAIVSSWRTNIAGPGGRGRTYWPFPPAAFNEDEGTPTDAFQAAMVGVSEAIIELTNLDFFGANADVMFVVWSRKNTVMREITQGVVQKKWGTQKRRGSYGRPNVSPFA